MLVNGLKGLEKLTNIQPITPSSLVIARILKTIGEKNAKLDRIATQELQNLFIKTGEMTGNLNKVISDSLEDAFKNSHERCHMAILESLGSIDQLNIESNEKSKIMKIAIKENLSARRAEINANSEIKKIVASGGAVSLVILAASVGYKYARKPTFMESVQKIIQSIL